MTKEIPLCYSCTFIEQDKKTKVIKCVAYPEGIPNRFLKEDGFEEHTTVQKDQVGTTVYLEESNTDES